MIPGISQIYSSLTAAAKALTGLHQITMDGKVAEKVIEVQGIITELMSKINDVNTKYAELLESKDEVQTKLEEYENWNAKAANYELKELVTGAFVQALKPSAQTGEPSHYACPKCFEKRKRSVLQGIDKEALFYRCPECSFETEPLTNSQPVQPTVNFPGLPRGGMR